MQTLDAERLQELLCKRMCADVKLHPRPDGRLMVETPFVLPDGDTYAIFLQPLQSGGVRITDAGLTMMRISYNMDLDKLKEGKRAALLAALLAESGVSSENGELFIDTPAEDLARQLFTFGQAITRISDLTHWQQVRVAATFLEDVHEALKQIVQPARIQKEYVVPDVEQSELYPVDFRIDAPRPRPQLFLFGIPSKDKARLTTITIQYFRQRQVSFESLLVFRDLGAVPNPDLVRLLNAGGEVVTLDAKDEMAQKVLRRVA